MCSPYTVTIQTSTAMGDVCDVIVAALISEDYGEWSQYCSSKSSLLLYRHYISHFVGIFCAWLSVGVDVLRKLVISHASRQRDHGRSREKEGQSPQTSITNFYISSPFKEINSPGIPDCTTSSNSDMHPKSNPVTIPECSQQNNCAATSVPSNGDHATRCPPKRLICKPGSSNSSTFLGNLSTSSDQPRCENPTWMDKQDLNELDCEVMDAQTPQRSLTRCSAISSSSDGHGESLNSSPRLASERSQKVTDKLASTFAMPRRQDPPRYPPKNFTCNFLSSSPKTSLTRFDISADESSFKGSTLVDEENSRLPVATSDIADVSPYQNSNGGTSLTSIFPRDVQEFPRSANSGTRSMARLPPNPTSRLTPKALFQDINLRTSKKCSSGDDPSTAFELTTGPRKIFVAQSPHKGHVNTDSGFHGEAEVALDTDMPRYEELDASPSIDVPCAPASTSSLTTFSYSPDFVASIPRRNTRPPKYLKIAASHQMKDFSSIYRKTQPCQKELQSLEAILCVVQASNDCAEMQNRFPKKLRYTALGTPDIQPTHRQDSRGMAFQNMSTRARSVSSYEMVRLLLILFAFMSFDSFGIAFQFESPIWGSADLI